MMKVYLTLRTDPPAPGTAGPAADGVATTSG
jgi:hypothetical protein